ncbi:ferritin-like protein [Humibacillus xanthopallidus]|uniref:Ferritin-like protein n=1 Tax=Humibacillus xanthopallidus TaxID=412689 RepID=A0A543PPF1_9MICO|nr:ferritin-like protein [Humibacillus xanthopallidus]TQN45955.1 ferritin-like protein [Humibacillus xanthopallidus]
MITIERRHVDEVRGATRPSDLYPSLQAAIELEHATIPPYLTALFSIKQGHNSEAAAIIGSVVGEEMLHLTIACNVLNAIGGTPRIDDPTFIPSYPGPLPMGVHSSLTVGLAKLSRRLVHDVFMAIEEPESVIHIPDGVPRALTAMAGQPEFATIGQFYAAIKEKLADLEDASGKQKETIFVGDPARQVVDSRWYSSAELFAVSGLASALAAIDVIVEQGEGTGASPLDGQHVVAHYYRFAEIVHGRRLVSVDAPPGWAFAGEPVGLDPAGVWDLVTDAKSADYPAHSPARVLVDMFNLSYTTLLGALDRTFNGHPDELSMALSVMVEMQLTAQKLVSTRLPGTGRFAAPTFEYVRGAASG